MNHYYYSTILKRKSIQFLFQGFKKLYKKMYSNDLKTLSITFIKKQFNIVTVIICSDSRANVEKIFDRKYGKVFMHGSIIHLTPKVKKKDLSSFSAAALEYIVVFLKTLTVIILGHFNYVAIKTYLESYLGLDKGNPRLLPLKKEVKNIKALFLKKLLMKDVNLMVKYLEEAVFIESLKKLRAYFILQERIKNKKLITIACLFNIKNGESFS